MKTNETEIKTPKNGWVVATKLPSYRELYDAICHVAGEGKQVTADQVGKSGREFMYDEIRLIELRGSEVLYSINREDGSLAAEFVGVWSK